MIRMLNFAQLSQGWEKQRFSYEGENIKFMYFQKWYWINYRSCLLQAVTETEWLRTAASLPPENTASWDTSSSETQFKSCLFQVACLDYSFSRWYSQLVGALGRQPHLDLNPRPIFSQLWLLRGHLIPLGSHCFFWESGIIIIIIVAW